MRKKQGMLNKPVAISEDLTDYQKSCRKRWAALIRKIYEVDPLICPQCGAKMKIVPAIEACPELAEVKTNFISISRRIQVQHHLFIFGCFFSYCLRVQRAYPTIIVTPIIITITASINSHLLF